MKRGRGRPKKYLTEEERKRAITQIKTKYMTNKEWRCPICDNHDYTLAGKWTHLHSNKHKNNEAKMI